MADYSKIKHLKDLNNSMFNERMNRAYDYGYEEGLARGTECGYKRGYENGKKSKQTGHWIADVFVDICSVCGEQTLFFEDQQKNFCPNCGARMVEQERSDKE